MTVNTFQEYVVLPLIMILPRAHYNSGILTASSARITISMKADFLSVSRFTKEYGSQTSYKTKNKKGTHNFVWISLNRGKPLKPHIYFFFLPMLPHVLLWTSWSSLLGMAEVQPTSEVGTPMRRSYVVPMVCEW
jgi:hypothetical protein